MSMFVIICTKFIIRLHDISSFCKLAKIAIIKYISLGASDGAFGGLMAVFV